MGSWSGEVEFLPLDEDRHGAARLPAGPLDSGRGIWRGTIAATSAPGSARSSPCRSRSDRGGQLRLQGSPLAPVAGLRHSRRPRPSLEHQHDGGWTVDQGVGSRVPWAAAAAAPDRLTPSRKTVALSLGAAAGADNLPGHPDSTGATMVDRDPPRAEPLGRVRTCERSGGALAPSVGSGLDVAGFAGNRATVGFPAPLWRSVPPPTIRE